VKTVVKQTPARIQGVGYEEAVYLPVEFPLLGFEGVDDIPRVVYHVTKVGDGRGS
jgi:hypothetical protein